MREENKAKVRNVKRKGRRISFGTAAFLLWGVLGLYGCAGSTPKETLQSESLSIQEETPETEQTSKEEESTVEESTIEETRKEETSASAEQTEPVQMYTTERVNLRVGPSTDTEPVPAPIS